MEEIDIIKISINKEDYFEIKGKLNKQSKRLLFDISFEMFEKIFGEEIHKLLLLDINVFERKSKNIYLLDEYGIYYSCIDCIWSVHSKSVVSFSLEAVNLILEGIITDTLDTLEFNKITFKTCYLGYPIHSCYIRDFSSNYDSTKKIKIRVYRDTNFCIDFSVESKKSYNYKKLSKIIYTIIEMVMLLWGDIPNINEIVASNAEKEIKIYYNLVEKYNPVKKKRLGKEILGNITEETINKDNIKKFLKFRKDTKIIYDLYMINVNSSGYVEVKNCNLIQMLEGLHRSIYNTSDNLRCILNYFFDYSKSSRILLTRRDKRKIKDPNTTRVFIYKANNHRNYLSHLNSNQNKNVFYKKENNYAYWKLCMCIRLFILEYLNISYDKEAVKEYVNDIEVWTKKNKLRFSSKVNK